MEVIHLVEVKHYAAGAIIFSEGQPGDTWFVLYRAAVGVLKHGMSGEMKITDLPENACCGDISMFDGSPRPATIRAGFPYSARRLLQTHQ